MSKARVVSALLFVVILDDTEKLVKSKLDSTRLNINKSLKYDDNSMIIKRNEQTMNINLEIYRGINLNENHKENEINSDKEQ